MSDPAKYRTKDEVARWKAQDPLHRHEEELRTTFGVSEEALEALDDEVVEEMQAAVDFADASPPPDPEERFEHLYVEDPSAHPDLGPPPGDDIPAVTVRSFDPKGA